MEGEESILVTYDSHVLTTLVFNLPIALDFGQLVTPNWCGESAPGSVKIIIPRVCVLLKWHGGGMLEDNTR